MYTLTKDEALNALVYLGYLRIRALVETSALHLYGRLPMGIDDMQVPELVSWFLIHFEFDESAQKWILYRDNTERLEDQSNEHDYYGVFG